MQDILKVTSETMTGQGPLSIRNTAHIAHKRLTASILLQDLVDFTLFCLVYLPLFVELREINPTKMGFWPKNPHPLFPKFPRFT